MGWASATFSNKSKLYRWTRAGFGGQPIPREYSFTPGDLVGRKVRLTVLVKVRDDGEEYNKVEEVLPLREQNLFPQGSSEPQGQPAHQPPSVDQAASSVSTDAPVSGKI